MFNPVERGAPSWRALSIVAFVVLCSAPVQAGTIKLAWDPSPGADIAGYRVSYGTSTGVYSVSVDVGNTTTWTGSALVDGRRYYFAVQAYNRAGLQSPFSAEVSGVSAAGTGGLSVTPAELRFAATGAGAAGVLQSVTPPQVLDVVVAGATSWTATANQPWVRIVPGSGTASGQFTVGIASTGLPAGASSGTAVVTVTAAALGLTVTVPVTLTLEATGAAPYGAFDTPVQNASGLAGSIAMTGWALDDLGVSRVMLWRNCVEAIDRPAGACVAAVPGGLPDYVYVGDGVFLAGARPDIVALNPTVPEAYRAGWGYLMLTNALPHLPQGAPHGGQGQFRLSAYAVDQEQHYTLLGQKTVTLDNDHASLPFGAIDTPDQGGTMTTGVSANFGWAMTPAGQCINTASRASYKVYIDGVARTLTSGTNWFSGLDRPDIAAAYPNLCNTHNALAAYYIDAAALGLANGLHTIGWDVVDSRGRVAGIGSRFFKVLMAGAAASLGAEGGRPGALGLASDFDAFAPSPRETPAHARVPVGGRLHLALGGPVDGGYQIVGDEVRALPIGSTLDAATGRFAWQPPVPFLGTFHLVFTTSGARQDVFVTIVDPTTQARVQMHVDSPGPATAIAGRFVVAGWAFDPLAMTGSGIDTLHVWAYRRDVDGVAPQFLGAAAVGAGRPDVAAAFGGQFDAAGFTLSVDGLASGVYDLLVYPWSHRRGRFEDAARVAITVQ